MEPIEFGDPRIPLQFWKKVRVSDDSLSPCWHWIGRHTPTGWPEYSGKSAWRVAYMKTMGVKAPPVRAMICETAPKRCINPYHRLYLSKTDSGHWVREDLAALDDPSLGPSSLRDLPRAGAPGVWSEDDLAEARKRVSPGSEDEEMARLQALHAATYSDADDEGDDEEELDHLVPLDYEPPDDGTPLPFAVRPPRE